MKTAISKDDLARIALQELRALPGTDQITSAYIESGDDRWALVVRAKEGADLRRIQVAVRRTENFLEQRYELRRDH
jgi:hypothetical protein